MGVRKVLTGLGLAVVLAVPAVPALAQYGPTSTTPSTTTTTTTAPVVSGVTVTQPTVTVPPTPGVSVQPRVLARTGQDIFEGVAVGAALVGAGTLVVIGARRRRNAAA